MPKTRLLRWTFVLIVLGGISWQLYCTDTTSGKIRCDIGIWRSHLVVFRGVDVSEGDSRTNVAVTRLSSNEWVRLHKQHDWTRDDRVIDAHMIPWYSDLVISSRARSILDRSGPGKKPREWLTTGLTRSKRVYRLYFSKDQHLLWIVQYEN